MRDQTAIASFSRRPQSDGRILFCFADISILAEEWEDIDSDVHLRPVSGVQVDCGGWHDLADDEVAAYCELLEDEMRRRNC